VVSLQETGLSISGVLFGSQAKDASVVVRSSFDADYLNPAERRYEYIITQFRVLLTYFRLLLFPINQTAYYDYPVYRSFSDPQVFLSLLIHITVIIAAVLAFFRSRRGTPLWILVTFGILWFYITIALESSVIPLPLLICEYRVYLPGVGLFIATVAALSIYVSKQRVAFVVVCTLAVVILGTATYQRNKVWNSRVSLWSDVIRKAPNNEKGYINTGSTYMLEGNMQKALRFYLEVYKRHPLNASTNYNLGVIYRSTGDVHKAIEHYIIALKAKPNYANALFNLGNAYMALNDVGRAIETYEKLLELHPYLPDAHVNLSIAYQKIGDEKDALEHAEIARQMKNSRKIR